MPLAAALPGLRLRLARVRCLRRRWGRSTTAAPTTTSWVPAGTMPPAPARGTVPSAASAEEDEDELSSSELLSSPSFLATPNSNPANHLTAQSSGISSGVASVCVLMEAEALLEAIATTSCCNSSMLLVSCWTSTQLVCGRMKDIEKSCITATKGLGVSSGGGDSTPGGGMRTGERPSPSSSDTNAATARAASGSNTVVNSGGGS
mmetsp:Transcript_57802/g.146718  ORF Transcript_57802/g.146718 Transcript_57802/m.146718 type:complete len:205 (-) Transcript_57802:1397-2011(-)